MKHTQPIITNARTGRPVSTNYLRKSLHRSQCERIALVLSVLIFWAAVVLLILITR
jgi:hypothetical protein